MPKTPKGVRLGGRQKGTPNKSTASVRAAFEEAFEKLGGADALVEWAEKEPTEFYKLYAKLIPVKTEVSGIDGSPIQVITSVAPSDAGH